VGLSRFTDIGTVMVIHPSRESSRTGAPSTCLELDIDGDRHFIMATGRQMLEFVDTKLKLGDIIYVEGKQKKDKIFNAEVPKNIIIKFANHISVLIGA
jgi:hypothetical protein